MTNAWVREMIPRLYVEQPLGVGAAIATDERAHHYLRNVMRRSVGDAWCCSTGAMASSRRRSPRFDKRKAELKVTQLRRAQDSVPDLVLCFAPLKKDAIDFLIEKGTELGVAAFQPVITRRTVTTPHQSRAPARQRDRSGGADRAIEHSGDPRAAQLRGAAGGLATAPGT